MTAAEANQESRDINVALAKAIGWDDQFITADEAGRVFITIDDESVSRHVFSYEDPTVIKPIIERFNVQVTEANPMSWAHVPGHSMRFGRTYNQAAAHAVIEAMGGNG